MGIQDVIRHALLPGMSPHLHFTHSSFLESPKLILLQLVDILQGAYNNMANVFYVDALCNWSYVLLGGMYALAALIFYSYRIWNVSEALGIVRWALHGVRTCITALVWLSRRRPGKAHDIRIYS